MANTAAKKPAAAKKAAVATNSTKPASELDPSGAPHPVANVDPNHPALDVNLRADTNADQNRIDLNDPALTEEEAVTKNLSLSGAKD